MRGLIVAAVLLLTVGLTACGGSNAGLSASYPHLRMVVRDGSGWTADELALEAVRHGNGWDVAVRSEALQPADALYLEVEHDPAYGALNLEQLCGSRGLQLLTSAPGVVGLGLVCVGADELLAPGEVLRFRLEPGRQTAQVGAGMVSAIDLDGERTEESLLLHWSYALRGDYDQNSEVNAADLAPISLHFLKKGPFDYASIESVVDGDANGEINAADIAPIAGNFRALATGYEVYASASADPADAPELLSSVVFGASSADGGRRWFSTELAGDALAARFYHVRMQFAPAGQADPSNVLDSPPLEPPVDPIFAVAPVGQSVFAAGIGTSPSLALLPGNGGTVEDGAPLIAYVSVTDAGLLHLAHYQDGAWVSVAVDGRAYTSPQLLVQGAERLLVAFDVAAAETRLLHFNGLWELQSVEPVKTLGGGVPLALDAAVAESGEVVVAASFAAAPTVRWSRAVPGEAWTGADMELPGTVFDLSCAFAPDGEPHLLVSHGTFDATAYQISSSLQHQRWGEPEANVGYVDSPLRVDAQFDAAGRLRAAFTAVREFTVPLIGFSASLLFDGVVGTLDSGTWSFQKHFTGTLTPTFVGFPPSAVDLALLAALDTGWAAPGAVAYNVAQGTVRLTLPELTPESGAVANMVRYGVESSGSFADTAYFTGAPGVELSWDQRGTHHGTAYIGLDSLSSADILGGNLGGSGELLYWRK